MVARRELEFKGPFLRLGNTFFDRQRITFEITDARQLDDLDYSTASRIFLKHRLEEDLGIFGIVPEYLKRNINGIIWHNLILLYSFSMPHNEIVRLYRFFEEEVTVHKNQYIAYYMFKLLTESQIYDCVRMGVDAFSVLAPDINHREIACIYSMILEDDVGYDKRLSKIIQAQAKLDKTSFVNFIRDTAVQKLSEFPRHEHSAFHNGRPVDILDVFGKLLNALAKPSFYEKIYFEKVLIEAFAGVDLSDFYDKLNLQPQRAAMRLEQAADEITFDHFQPGKRYFFGRQLPG
ncbi:hypothetical protein OHD62_10950 [Mesorhizobium sp. YC-39]|uniref:hypothetical protein n=1 Tax=unclassified Mesorhizobium TaxID=325217 RepID=UPI0021E89406|nr:MULTISPECIES: hypothetical protein [unclassified Mesorhizobium]MCV3207162.1 hypothetical protein [Mesorhizobium sp. YC-2]MCV3228889.1 hypothetical protein [Mesorhizobium sp. YC-39]